VGFRRKRRYALEWNEGRDMNVVKDKDRGDSELKEQTEDLEQASSPSVVPSRDRLDTQHHPTPTDPHCFPRHRPNTPLPAPQPKPPARALPTSYAIPLSSQKRRVYASWRGQQLSIERRVLERLSSSGCLLATLKAAASLPCLF